MEMLSQRIIMNTLKAYASRYLNTAQVDAFKRIRWTRHGSTLYLWNELESRQQ